MQALTFSQKGNKSNPVLVQNIPTHYFEHQNILLYIQTPTKWLSQWHPKVITSGVKQNLSTQSLHPTYHCILSKPSDL